MVGASEEEVMECYDESAYCCYCNLKFRGKAEVVHQGSHYHERCWGWLQRKERIVSKGGDPSPLA